MSEELREVRDDDVLPAERSLIEDPVVAVSLRRVVSVLIVLDEVELGLDVAELEVLLLGDDGVAAELRDGLLIEPPVVFAVLPLGAVCVLVLGPGVSFADGGFVFLPVSLTAAPEVLLGDVLVCA